MDRTCGEDTQLVVDVIRLDNQVELARYNDKVICFATK